MTFAGLWETHERFGMSFTILTTASAGAVAPLHDRMPVILEPEQFELWLDPAAEPAALKPLLRPYAKPDLVAFPVSPRVNSVKHDDAALIVPLAPAAAGQGDLFGG
jgi:putative SOS response-associated peptidase YedK